MLRASLFSLLALCAFATTASAEFVVTFINVEPTNGFAGNMGDPTFSVSIDGGGAISGASTHTDPEFLDQAAWTYTGAETEGLGSTIGFAFDPINGSGNPATIPVRYVDGVGVQGNAPGEIDRNVSTGANGGLELAQLQVDASGLGSEYELHLVSVSWGDFVEVDDNGTPDDTSDDFAGVIRVIGFDGTEFDSAELTPGGGTFDLNPGDVTLAGGATDVLALTQPIKPSVAGGITHIGYVLAALEFDIVRIPEPSAGILVATTLGLLVAGRKRS